MKILLLLLLFIAACTGKSSKQTNNNPALQSSLVATPVKPTTLFINPTYACNYDLQKKRCQQIFDNHKKQKLPDSKRKLISYITDSLLPCWYGTPWDFNGITEVPVRARSPVVIL